MFTTILFYQNLTKFYTLSHTLTDYTRLKWCSFMCICEWISRYAWKFNLHFHLKSVAIISRMHTVSTSIERIIWLWYIFDTERGMFSVAHAQFVISRWNNTWLFCRNYVYSISFEFSYTKKRRNVETKLGFSI